MSKGLHIHTKVYIVVVDLTKSSSIAALYVVHTHIHTHTAEAGKVERKCCEKGQKTHMPYKLTHTMLLCFHLLFACRFVGSVCRVCGARRNLLGLVFKAPLKLLFLHVFFLCKFTSFQQIVIIIYIHIHILVKIHLKYFLQLLLFHLLVFLS